MSAGTQSNLVNRLVIAIREEVATQRRILELLNAQEGSIRQPAGPAFKTATEELEVQLKRSSQRTARRERAVVALAEEFGVAPSAATVGSLVERLGVDGELLAVERAHLVEVSGEIGRLNRRISSAGAPVEAGAATPAGRTRARARRWRRVGRSGRILSETLHR